MNMPFNSTTFIRNWFLSSSTRLRPCSIKLSNLTVNLAMRSRRSLNPKSILGRVSAIEGASADAYGGRIVLVESDGSKSVAMMRDLDVYG